MRGRLLHFQTRPELLAISLILAIDLVWMRGVGIEFVNIGVPLVAAFVLLLIAVLYGYTGRSKRLSDMAYYGAMFIIYAPLLVVMSYLAARSGGTLCDPELSKFDTFFGFDWRHWAAFLRTHPVCDALLAFAYASLMPQLWLTILLLALMKKESRLKELFWTVLVSSLATTILFDWFPAVGPFAFYDVDLVRAVHLRDLVGLRSGAVNSYSVPQLQGIIAFPSYHTVMALLIPYVHRGLRHTFLPCLGLNALMLVSVPTHGGHYMADIVGGAVISLGSIALVRSAADRASQAEG